MSRMLRGQATLQSIIGKNSITKREGNVHRSLKHSGIEAALPAPAPIEAAPQESIDAPRAPIERPAPPNLPEGCVACPVCGKQLSEDTAEINFHLGKLFPTLGKRRKHIMID